VSFIEDKEGWHGKPLKKGEELERALAEIRDSDTEAEPLKMKSPEGRTAKPLADGGEAPANNYEVGKQFATREVYGAALARLGSENTAVVALDGDTKNSTYSEKFMKAHPARFFECFIAEQNMVSAAVGLGALGKIPFVSTFACFLSRAYDQIRMAAISQANLKLCGSHAGVSIGEDGPSQMALEDLAMMRAIEGSTVFYPSDAVSTEAAVRLAASRHGIFYIRTTRPKTPVIYPPDENFEIGRAKVVRRSEGDRITIVAAGVTLFEALAACDELRGEGIPVRVVDIFSVKPIDATTLESAARETGNLILSVEDHSLDGGLGDAVASAVAPAGIRAHKLGVGLVPRSGKPEELLAAYGIDRRAIVEKVKLLLSREA
ncbi:MAG TPA: transketolase, partial [Blastocatellia bacterium]